MWRKIGKYEFILDNMCYSFSRVGAFNNCPYGWELYYIFGEEQVDGFFGQFGSFCHLVLEKYFKDELELWDLTTFYEKEYYNNVTMLPPPYPEGMADTYYQRGYDFFDNFEFDKSDWEVEAVEETFYTKIDKYEVVIKPDLRLRNKTSGEVVIFDYKTSDVSKKAEYEKTKLQIHFYALGVLLYHNILVNKGTVLAIRTGELLPFEITEDGMEHARKWFLDNVEKIEQENDFKKGKPSKYFCDHLCGSRNKCKYRGEG